MSERIAMTLEDDGQVLIAAADVVAHLRACAERYGSGEHGGTRLLRKGAQDALAAVADNLESACIDVAADALTDVWWRS